MMEVYHSWNGQLFETVIFGGCKKDNWANGVLGIFVDGIIDQNSTVDCWGSQTK